MSTAPAAIGGYPALERGPGRALSWVASDLAYQSARAALAALLRATRPAGIWLPHYVCAAVDEAVAAAGIPFRRYPLAEDLGVPDDIVLAEGEWLLCVDYFGISGQAIDRCVSRLGRQRVIVDASQALFRSPVADGMTLYSPRKFVGVPDGGWLVAAHRLPLRAPADEAASQRRCEPLLARLAGEVESGYPHFLESEATLRDCAPRAMSRLTAALLASIDFAAVSVRRRRNYRALQAMLGAQGFNVPPLPPQAVPLCCPLLDVDAGTLREALIGERIYCPRYWPEALVPPDDAVGRRLRDRTLFLPCDQRCGVDDVARLGHVVLALRGRG